MSVDVMLKNMQFAKQPYKMRYDIKVGDIIQRWVRRTGFWGWLVNYRILPCDGEYVDVGEVVASEEDKRTHGYPFAYEDMTPEEADRRGERVVRIIKEVEGP